MSLRTLTVLLVSLFVAGTLSATIFGTVRGVVRDEQHRPVAQAAVALRAASSDWQRTATTGADGSFEFQAVPLGRYQITVSAGGFASTTRAVGVTSAATAATDITLRLPTVNASIDVAATAEPAITKSPTTQTTVSRTEVEQTPGADQANSLSIITDFVPGAYVVHDQLHVRGGHQVSWLVDGVPVPNTNIASNAGPQFDPKDIDYMEMQRGGYSAEEGDRTYGVFNVVPRNGFERTDEGTLMLSAGTLGTTEDQVTAGSHTLRLAYYASLSANRSNAGLETPVPQIIHDRESGASAFMSLIAIPNSADQWRMVGAVRADAYQIPNDPDADAAGVRDRQREHDLLLNTSWVHTRSATSVVTVAPFFHSNTANFDGGSADPIATSDHRRSRYLGLQTTLTATVHDNDVRLGVFGFQQQDAHSFSVVANDGSGVAIAQRIAPSGNVEVAFAEDSITVSQAITLRAGVRLTRFSGGVQETAASPRLGAAIKLPAGVVVRGSWGRAYQPPPLATVSGPLLNFVLQQGFDILPLHGERDVQSDVGVAVPVRGWTFDAAAFRTEARNFFDHDVLGNSNIFLPLTIDRAHIRGIEATVSSPSGRRARFHLAYSHQTAEGEGAVVGGLTDFTPPEAGRFFLDHDQRQTVSAGGTLQLPAASWVGANLNYGSGFLQGDGPAHLPSHTTADIAAGTTFGRLSLRLTATNVTNRRYLLDQANTFGGTHFIEPRKVIAQAEWRFRY